MEDPQKFDSVKFRKEIERESHEGRSATEIARILIFIFIIGMYLLLQTKPGEIIYSALILKLFKANTPEIRTVEHK